jgi:ssDNA-binding Zn-finger/Zn-ribbon topoisomerase 1
VGGELPRYATKIDLALRCWKRRTDSTEQKYTFLKKYFAAKKKKKELFREFLRGRGRKVFVAFCRRPKCDKYEEAESYFRITTSERDSEPKPKLRQTVKTPTT